MKKMMMTLAVAGICGAGVAMAEEAAQAAPAAAPAAEVALPMMEPEAPQVKAFSWDDVPAVVAKIGDKDITRDQLKKFIMDETDGAGIPAGVPADQAMIMLYMQATQLVQFELLQDVLKSEKIETSPELIKKSIEDELASLSEEDKAALTEALKQKGMTMEDMVKEACANPMSQAQVGFMELGKKLTAGEAKVTVDDAKKFYNENIEMFTTPGSVQVAHILVKSEPDEAADAAQKAKIEKILADVRANPASFADAAKADSICPSSANGGDLEMELDRNTRNIDKTFLAASLPLKEGEISDVVKTQFGYHIIKCLKRTEDKVEPLTPELEKELVRNLERRKYVTAASEALKAYEANHKVEMLMQAPQFNPQMMMQQ